MSDNVSTLRCRKLFFIYLVVFIVYIAKGTVGLNSFNAEAYVTGQAPLDRCLLNCCTEDCCGDLLERNSSTVPAGTVFIKYSRWLPLKCSSKITQ